MLIHYVQDTGSQAVLIHCWLRSIGENLKSTYPSTQQFACKTSFCRFEYSGRDRQKGTDCVNESTAISLTGVQPVERRGRETFTDMKYTDK